jgi:ubiquinone/menaquinone biosynthesis C-methylase UbiE
LIAGIITGGLEVSESNKRICPVESAGGLDNGLRRWLQNPQKLLGPYVTEGMTVLDVGCGPGFFSVEMARMVGKSGRVIASDLQEGMLQIVKGKIMGTELEERILLHKCGEKNIGVSEPVDFVLLFYMVHEVPDKEHLFSEIRTILKQDGQVLIVEPPFHVSRPAFEETVRIAGDAGFVVAERPRILFSKAVLLRTAR